MDDSAQLILDGIIVMSLGFILITVINHLEALQPGYKPVPCNPHQWEETEGGFLACKKCFIKSPRSQPVVFKDKKDRK